MTDPKNYKGFVLTQTVTGIEITHILIEFRGFAEDETAAKRLIDDIIENQLV
jgi:hypothetical protein